MLNKMKYTGLSWLWVSIIVFSLDRLTKHWIEKKLILHEILPVNSFFNLTLAYNTGAAFSFLNSASGWQVIFFGLIALVVSIAIIIWLANISAKQRWLAFALSLVVGGALGNLSDRLMYGHVIDFLNFHFNDWHFAAFNVADSAICIGAFMLFVEAFLFSKK